MEVFKIRNKEGLYFSQLANTYSWSNPKWNKTGKMWNKIEDIFKFINSYKLNPQSNIKALQNIKDCEIVKFELIEKEVIKID